MLNPNLYQYICINCGSKIKELYKKFTPEVIKLTKCEKCHKIADKYIEFETVIILIDSILLSKCAYRHILYNGDFKIHWKLSLVLLLLESFALWRQKLEYPLVSQTSDDFVNEKGFYICCLQNILENLILLALLEAVTIILNIYDRKQYRIIDLNQAFYLHKAITVANFAKFFLLPILIWKDNTTELGSVLHYYMVMGYYLVSLAQVYSVVTRISGIQSLIVTLFVFSMKQYVAKFSLTYVNGFFLKK